jgi:geranylgeranylglycerol-phosphate geranylgeranyltransferase
MTASMSKVTGTIRIIRPLNSMMVGFSILVGAAITSDASIFLTPIDLVFAFITGFSMSGASMAINDYYDRDIDIVNEPLRPIPSGDITPREAVIITLFLSVIGFSTSWMINIQAFELALFAWVLLMLYSAWGKRTGFLGNLMVSSCISMPFIYGGMITGSFDSTLTFSLLAFLTNTGREITKGIVDVKGDKKLGVRTIAVTQGIKKAANIASIFYLGAVISSIIPIYLELVSKWYIPFIIITDLGLLWGVSILIKEPSREMSRKVKNNILYFMLIGLLGFTVGSFK